MAVKTQGTIVYIQTGALATPVSITAITAANPPVVTTSAAHGYTNGDVVKITGVVGMQQVNNRAFVVAAASGSNFSLKGVDGTGYTTYVSGGSAAKATLSSIGEVREITSLGGTEPSEIDVSHLQSVAAEKLAGLPQQSNITFTVWFDLATANHTALIKANEDLADRVFHFQRPGQWNMTSVAQVAGLNVAGGDVNSAYSASVTLLNRAAGAWSTVA
jgi:hypothetical protein